MNKQAEPLQLQIFDRAARAYVPCENADLLGAVDADTARTLANGKPWRICKADRPLKPRYVPPTRRAAGHAKDDVVRAYLAWARDKGLTRIHAYPGFGMAGAPAYGLSAREVLPDDQFAVTETTVEE